jgi:site-specific DNA recombinase
MPTDDRLRLYDHQGIYNARRNPIETGKNQTVRCLRFMRDMLKLIWWIVIGLFRSRASLEAEILTLRHQLNVLRRKAPKRVAFSHLPNSRLCPSSDHCQRPKTAATHRQDIRCAIYTRKSSDEGLEQEFNSLDAQREACEAYIVSQRHAGWIALAAMYDDGGLSGGTTERPALKRLLADIKAGKVQIVVVYKVDRLTRSLADFAKIVDILDAHNASFVSVTQQFNTTTSMGRLTLNMLLSFAQFEREIAGERIRDKIAASKRKGMWMGGNVPLGYDVRDRKLIVNEPEALTVRLIFRRYAELGSVSLLRAELDRQGTVSKRREGAGGRLTGGQRFSRGALYLMLQNRIYRGEIVHQDTAYPGRHKAIIEPELWQIVEDKLAANRHERSLACWQA